MPAPPLSNTFEGGTNGVEITEANSGSGSGDAFSDTTDGVEGSPYFSNTQARGTLSMRFNYTSAPGGTLLALWSGLGSLVGSVYFRFYLFIPSSLTDNNFYPIGIRTSANAASALLRLLSDETIQMRDASNSQIGSTSTTAVAIGQWVRLEVRVLSSTTAGEMEWRLYNDADSLTYDETQSASSAVLGANTDYANFGINVTAPASPFTVYFDDLAVSTDGWIGPSITPGRTYKRLYGPAQLTDSAADLYTCPTSTITRTLHIHASNPSGSPIDVNLSIGADTAATRVWDDLAISADGIKDVFDPYELAAGEKIQGWADTAGTVVVTITGYEDPV